MEDVDARCAELAARGMTPEAIQELQGAAQANRDLLDAVRALAYTDDRAARLLRPVDYKNLGPEELGTLFDGPPA